MKVKRDGGTENVRHMDVVESCPRVALCSLCRCPRRHIASPWYLEQVTPSPGFQPDRTSTSKITVTKPFSAGPFHPFRPATTINHLSLSHFGLLLFFKHKHAPLHGPKVTLKERETDETEQELLILKTEAAERI